MENVSVKDLSETHHLIGDFFPDLAPEEAWERYQLSASQLEHFEKHGFLSGVKLLEDEQVEILRAELEALTDPNHPGHRLFYEFHSNESADPDTVLFHSLGHWRITPGFHDVLWNPRFVVPASQLAMVQQRYMLQQRAASPAPAAAPQPRPPARPIQMPTAPRFALKLK